MYSWGSDTSGSDTGSTSWSGYDYGSVRDAYTPPTSTGGSIGTKGIAVVKYPLEKITTESTQPLVVAVDVTGSMADWPKLIFEKLPLLYGEVARYLPDVAISFAAVGDAYSDSYPVQSTTFEKGKDLDAKISALYPEAGGGGGAKESYELTAHFYNTLCDIPNAKKPIFIFAGDEGFYSKVEGDTLKKYFPASVSEGIDGKASLKQLSEKFDTYILRKPYEGTQESAITAQWKDALGPQKVLKLDDPRRIVDCIIGIVAASTGEMLDFSKRLSQRQEPEKVKSVMGTLHSLSADPATAVPVKKSSSTKVSKKLT